MRIENTEATLKTNVVTVYVIVARPYESKREAYRVDVPFASVTVAGKAYVNLDLTAIPSDLPSVVQAEVVDAAYRKAWGAEMDTHPKEIHMSGYTYAKAVEEVKANYPAVESCLIVEDNNIECRDANGDLVATVLMG